MNVYAIVVRDITIGRSETVILPFDESPLNKEHEYIVLDSGNFPLELSEYDNIEAVNEFIKSFSDKDDDSRIQHLYALANTYLTSEIIDAYEREDEPFRIIDVDEIASGWNGGNGLSGSDEDLGLALFEAGVSYLPFEVTDDMANYIRWDQNWFTAESDGWCKTFDKDHRTYLVKMVA